MGGALLFTIIRILVKINVTFNFHSIKKIVFKNKKRLELKSRYTKPNRLQFKKKIFFKMYFSVIFILFITSHFCSRNMNKIDCKNMCFTK